MKTKNIISTTRNIKKGWITKLNDFGNIDYSYKYINIYSNYFNENIKFKILDLEQTHLVNSIIVLDTSFFSKDGLSLFDYNLELENISFKCINEVKNWLKNNVWYLKK